MGFKRMKNKCLAMSLTVMLVGGNLLLVNANENTNGDKESIEVINVKEESTVKISSIKNNIIMESELDEEKTLNRELLNEVSYIEEKDGKTYLKLDFNNKIDEKSNLQVLINDNEIKYEIVLNELNKEATSIKFEISSIEDKITVKRNIEESNTQTQFDIDLLQETIKEESINQAENNQNEEVKPPQNEEVKQPVNNEKPEEKPQEPQLEAKNTSTQKGKLNSIENTIVSTDSSVESIARESLGKISYVEEIDGKTYAQLEFVKNLSKDKELKVFINGNLISYSTLSKDADKGKMIIKYEIPNVDTKTTIKCSVNNAQGESKEIEYDITFKKDTIKFIKDITSITINNVDNSLNNNDLNNNNNNNTTVKRSNATLQIPSSTGKVSSIKNEVSSSNSEFENLAKVQLNETTYIEEINGKTYAIFDFVENVSSKSNMKIIVDDKQVSHQVISSNFAKGNMRIKFEIPNLYADIEVKNYVEDKKTEINYDVELLRSTLKVEKESKPSKLPQTGMGIDGAMISVFGTSMVGVGTLLIKKKDE
ncbi:MAG: NEAT domain-containing protein [Romboutsia sp.]|uniref:NEAT domain-containing protein n=1 Tax=Romboutsia sp. TaxID=1965302 RepID=UPI003F2B9F51